MASIDGPSLASFYEGKRVAVIGAAGTVGSELVERVDRSRRGVNDLERTDATRARLAFGKREQQSHVADVGDAERAQREHAAHHAMAVLDAAYSADHAVRAQHRQLGDPVDRLRWRQRDGSGGTGAVAGRVVVRRWDRVELCSEVREPLLIARDRVVDRPAVDPRRVSELLGATRACQITADAQS